MSERLFFVFTLLFPFTCFSQPGYDKVAFSGEIRMGNSISQSERLPYQKAFNIILWYRSIDESRIKIEADEPAKKEPWDKDPGTKIRLYMPLDLYNQFVKSSMTIEANFMYELPQTKKIDTVTRLLTLTINKKVPKPKIPNATIEIEPILLGEPEKFTLTMMINNINENLNSSSTNQSGFANVVDKLEKYMDDYYDNRKINYETLIDFYHLLVFARHYVDDNSFFRQEGTKLKDNIDNLKAKITGDTIRLGKENHFQNPIISQELVTSTEVYEEYLITYARLKEYYSRLQLILFLKSK